MPQINRTTAGMGGIGGVSSLQSLIATLQNNMKLDKDITASDVNQLISAYNSWRNHDHTTDDLRGKDIFGNLSVYGVGGTYVNSLSSPSKDIGGTLFTNQPLLVVIADNILDTDVNAIINSINNIRDHLHTINDITA